ncbi:hypothetical protein BH09BAC6_BH09BAC6_13920 [soil metagenome]
MNEFQIQLEKQQIAALITETRIAGLLSELFRPSTENYFKLSYEIQREFKAGGSPQVTRMDFDRVHFNVATGEGKFRVLLDINFTFGCEDIHTEKQGQTSEWTFAVDTDTHIITFHGSPYAEGRSTADEF